MADVDITVRRGYFIRWFFQRVVTKWGVDDFGRRRSDTSIAQEAGIPKQSITKMRRGESIGPAMVSGLSRVMGVSEATFRRRAGLDSVLDVSKGPLTDDERSDYVSMVEAALEELRRL